MTENSPRLVHNENLGREFFKARGISASCPPVHEQVESVIINRRALPQFSYNASIAFHRGRYLLAYRHHPTNTTMSELGIAELDEKFNVKNHKPVKLVPSPPSAEDARLFLFNGELHMAWVESQWPVKPFCVVKFGLLVEEAKWRVVDVKQPAIGNNDGEHLEKNWIFFEHNKQLFCLYQSYPEQVIHNLSNPTPEVTGQEHRSPGLQWRYGPIRGGCVIPYHNKLLRFFHSGVDTYPRPWYRRYFIGHAFMENEPPFKVTWCSKEFDVQGSEADSLDILERNKSSHFKANVVFPMSAIHHSSDVILSCGINDTSIGLLKMKI